jgi:DMSO reductase anchor subunit
VFASCFLVALGLFFSTTHLGKPWRFYRGFNNLKFSPVCREGLGLALFIACAGLHGIFSLPENSVFNDLLAAITGLRLLPSAITVTIANAFGGLALMGGAGGLYYMIKCYRIKARPFWDHWNVATDFSGTALSLGAYLGGTFMLVTFALAGLELQPVHEVFRILLATGLALMLIGMRAHSRAMNGAEHEGAASYYIQSTVFGKTQTLRLAILVSTLVLCLVLVFVQPSPPMLALAWLLSGLALLTSHLIGRALFYVLVIPTTMPGAFFWKNKGFEQHAIDIGLVDMPQVGLVRPRH